MCDVSAHFIFMNSFVFENKTQPWPLTHNLWPAGFLEAKSSAGVSSNAD